MNTASPEELYAQVSQFYARHMHLLDSGDFAAWAATFTADGSFALPGRPQPTRGREQLVAGAKAAAKELAVRGETHRHWHGMIDVEPIDSGTLQVRCYALVFATTVGGDHRLHRICTCDDLLVREEDHWLVSRRVVSRDGFST